MWWRPPTSSSKNLMTMTEYIPITFSTDGDWHLCRLGSAQAACEINGAQFAAVCFFHCSGPLGEIDFPSLMLHALEHQARLCPRCVSDILHEAEIAEAAALLASDNQIWEGMKQ